ncbi:MAG: hypothetical protein IPJ65_12085 [Archangiaceae bacterium]|nr:hypothetical protein [Archangiaceae bacterium]
MTALLLLLLAAEPTPCADELCRSDVEDLKLVAISTGTTRGEWLAMFEDDDGHGMLARLNARIGKKGGTVTAIDSRCVTITEKSKKHERCIRAVDGTHEQRAP